MTVLFEVGLFIDRDPETSDIRHCDLCDYSFMHDAPPHRTFYYDPEEGLSVCAACVNGYLKEKP